MPDIEQTPAWADMGDGRDERVIYYRRPNGWITWGDTQMSKQVVMMRKGCQPLPQFGEITDSSDLWGPILRHPDGPAMFPVEQVLTYRWYRPDMLPDCRQIVQTAPRKWERIGVQPNVTFPQLKGVKITEFPCPEPCSRLFHSPLHLGSHLKVMHDYDRSEILKYGEAMGIDFSKTPGGKQLLSYEFTEEVAKEVLHDAEPEFTVESVTAAAPASPETAQEFETERSRVSVARFTNCPDCGKQVKVNGLSMHRMRWCKKAPVTA